MKRSIVLLFLSLVTVSAQITSPQTRPRRAGETAPTPSPSPGPSETKPDTELDVVRIDTSLVMVPVSVVDRSGRYISDLQKEDFQIAEDGVEQEIAYFGTVEKPFTVVLMKIGRASCRERV